MGLAAWLPAALLALPTPSKAGELLVTGEDGKLVKAVRERLGAEAALSADEVHPGPRALLKAKRAEALQHLELADAAMGQADTETATASIAVAVEAFEQAFAVVDDFEPIARAYLLRADLALATEDTATAEDSFMVAARYIGERELDPTTHSPLVIEGHKTALELLTNSPKGTLSVSTVPAGAEVWVDGVSKGPAPVEIPVPVGPHLVQVRLGDSEPWASTIPVEIDKAHKLEVKLRPISGIERALSTLSPADIAALRKIDGTREWLLVKRDDSGLRFAYLPVEGALKFGGPTSIGNLPVELEKAGWNPPSKVGMGEWGLLAAAAGGGVVVLMGGTALTLDGVMLFTDLGSADDRLGMQTAERVMLGFGALGLAAAAAGGALWYVDQME